MPFDLQTLSDRTEIENLSARYGRALDTRDWELLRSLFTEDAYADFGQGEAFEGVENILAGSSAVMDLLEHTQHIIGNQEISIDGDRASGQNLLIGSAFSPTKAGAPTLCEYGVYTDEYTRTSEGWRISRKVLTVSWCEGNLAILAGGPPADSEG